MSITIYYNRNTFLPLYIMTATRTSIAFNQDNWNKLASEPNRSKIVNKAVDLFYKTQQMLKEKEEAFLLDEIAHYMNTGEHYTFEETFKN